jgi:hypothetical protein
MSDQLIRNIKAHIAKGDKAKDKADQHYIAAGLHLKQLKASHDASWEDWEALLKDKIGIGKSRASELMQIADGRKTVEQVKSESAERKTNERKRIALRDVTESSPKPRIARHADLTLVMPTEAEAEEEYQQTIYDQACLFLEAMTDETRQRLFACRVAIVRVGGDMSADPADAA